MASDNIVAAPPPPPPGFPPLPPGFQGSVTMPSTKKKAKQKMPPGFNEHDFAFSKLYKSVNLIGQNVMCDVVRAMYSHDSMETEGGTMSLRDYLTNVKKWSNKKFKDFTKLHHYLLDEDLNSTKFDISFACDVINLACPELNSQLGSDCQKSISELKKLRNKICHNYGLVFDLDPYIEQLKDILSKIYEGVGVAVGRDFTCNISEMKERLSEILSARVAQTDIETYLEDVRTFKKDLKFRMITDGNKELTSYYSKLKILNPCIWMSEQEVDETSTLREFKTDKIFTPLKIEDRRTVIELKQLLSITRKFRGSDQTPSVLLMHGLAGCGKTSLCHFIIQEYCRKQQGDIAIDGLKDFDLLIFMEVRRARSKNLKDFLSLECLKETCRNFAADDVIPTLQDLNVLFVIDGFDEAQKGKSLEVVNDIFSRFYDKRILITTRPEFVTDVSYISRKFTASLLIIQICGFDENGQKEFSEKVFSAIIKDKDVCKNELRGFLAYIEGPGKVLNEHLKLPLTIALLIFLWKEDPFVVKRIISSTQLYYEIFKLCQKRLKERVQKLNRDKLDEELNELMFCLGKQGWHLLLEGELFCLREKEVNLLEKECKKKDVSSEHFLSSFLCCDTDENEDNNKRIHAFLHKTQMEYLAGAFLANAVDSSDDINAKFNEIHNEVKDKSSWRRHQEVIKFMTGSFAIKDSLRGDKIPQIFKFLARADISSADFKFWWSFYLESLKNQGVGREIVEDKLPHSDWKLDDEHVVAGLSFYYDLPVRLETLVIDIPVSVDPYNIKDFLPLLRDINHKKFFEKKRNRGKMNPALTELHLWFQENYAHSRSSNDFIEPLNPWAHLTNFTGKLDERETLNFSYKLKTINVRLDTAQAFRAFKTSLSRIYKNVRTLRVTLGVPFSLQPAELCSLEFTDKLELIIKGTKDENLHWIVEIVSHVNGGNGCNKLTLTNTEINYDAIQQLLKSLENVVHEKICLDTISDITEIQKEELKVLEREMHIELNWIDP